jgi:hypothetical protein
MTDERAALERMFAFDACERLARSEQAYYSKHGQYLPPLARLLNATRYERDDLAARVVSLQERLADAETEKIERGTRLKAAEEWAKVMEHERDYEQQVVSVDLQSRLDDAEALSRVQAEQIAALQEALRDEIAMADQSVETLRDLRKNWERIIDEQDDDGGPLIENILYWLIEDVKPDGARAALALAEGCAAPAPEEEK